MKKISQLISLLFLAFLLLQYNQQIFSQGVSRPDRGASAIAPFQSSNVENINLQNGNVGLSIPLASLPSISGGKLSFTIYAHYNSKLWDTYLKQRFTGPDPGSEFYWVNIPRISDFGGWKIGGTYGLYEELADDDYVRHSGYVDNDNSILINYQWRKTYFITPDGSKHEIRPLSYPSFWGSNTGFYGGYFKDSPYTTGIPMRYYTVDGSYIWLTVYPPNSPLAWEANLPDGTKIQQSNDFVQRIIDTNGNKIKIFGDNQETHYQDEQTGREIRIGYNSTTGKSGVSYQATGGVWQTIEIVYGTTTVAGKFYSVEKPTVPYSNGCIYQEPFTETLSVVREVIFPQTESGQTPPKYTFSYNSDVTDPNGAVYSPGCNYYPPTSTYSNPSKGLGEISQMTTPTGAVYKYSYLLDNEHITSDGTSDESAAANSIVQKTIDHDGVTDTWNYQINPFYADVTNPDGSTQHLDMHSHNAWQPSTNGGVDGLGGLVYRETDSNKIRKERRWARLVFTGANEITADKKIVFNPVVTEEYTILLDDGGNPVKMSAKTFQYDYNGNLKVTNEYDWFDPNSVSRNGLGVPLGVPAGAILLRTTTNNYYNSPSGSNAQEVYAKTSNSILNAVKDTSVGNSQTRFSYDGLSYGTAPTNGNPTQVSTWDNTNNQWLNSSSTYDSYGNVLTTTDPKGYVTQIFYEDNTHALPTKTIVDPQNGTGQHISTATYDFSTGLPLTQTDINGNVSSISYINHLLGAVDPFGRAGTTYSPYITIDGVNKRLTAKTYYEDGARRIRSESDLYNEGDALVKARVSSDQLGRAVLSEKNENGAAAYTIFSETKYNSPINRTVMTSNPHRGTASPTDGWTRAMSDTLGRTVEVATFSGAAQPPLTGTAGGNFTGKVTSSYLSNTTTVTDQAGKQRRSAVNALGQLIRVDEPNDAGQLDVGGVPAQPTGYIYDALGNLTQIVQGGQTRSFTYSSLSRLLTATNPESGSFTHTYDNNGNLLTKKDARNVTTTYTYDALNRVTLRDYSDATPDISYTYDEAQVPFSKGKLTKISSSVSEMKHTAFDAQERILSSQQITDGQTYNFGYTYNLNGGLATQTYPSTKVVKYDYDNGGDLAQVGNNQTQKFYANSFGYTAHGQVEWMRLGNGKWETTKFNSSLQITEVGLGHSATDTGLWKTNYEYGEWENNAINTQKNNGNLARQTISVPTIGAATGFTAVQTYNYDKLDRVQSATETVSGNQTWKQTFLYDRFANKNFDTANTTTLGSCAAAVCNPTANQANNRLNGYGYDAAGNITTDGEGRTFTYDGENRQLTAVGNNLSMSYAYDGNDKRVKSFNAITNQTTIFVYDADGDLAAEYTINVPPPTSPTISYLTQDALGSVRVISNSFGEIKARRDFLPFGEEIYAGIGSRTSAHKYSANGDDTRKKFATYQRDWETGLDYAQSRYYSPTTGRFTSPDEFKGGPDELFDFEDDASSNPTFYADLENPQSLNKYQYGYNNPYKFNDPNGHCPTCEEVAGTVGGAVIGGAIGSTVGAIIGGLLGGSGGTLVAPVVGTIGGGVAGANTGAIIGGAIGAFIGGAIGNNVSRPAQMSSSGNSRSSSTQNSKSNLKSSSKRGQESEKRVLKSIGEKKNTAKVSSKEGNSVPDFKNKKQIGEIKDTKKVSNTRQMRIQRAAARKSNREHIVITGKKTHVSKPMQESGTKIIRRGDLGPQ